MKLRCLAAGLLLASCAEAPSAAADYDAVVRCEMVVLVVANFHPSINEQDRASLRAKSAELSKLLLQKAQALGKSTGEIAADQQHVLKSLQARVQGRAGEAEARRMVREAKSCSA